MRHRNDGYKLGRVTQHRWALFRNLLVALFRHEVVGRLFDTIAARFADRHGGYTRIIKAGPRPGDGAPMVFLELVDRAETPKDTEKKAEKKERAPRGEAGATGRRKRKEKAAAASA